MEGILQQARLQAYQLLSQLVRRLLYGRAQISALVQAQLTGELAHLFQQAQIALDLFPAIRAQQEALLVRRLQLQLLLVRARLVPDLHLIQRHPQDELEFVALQKAEVVAGVCKGRL